MKTKNVVLIGVAVLAIAGIAYAYTRKKDETKTGADGSSKSVGKKDDVKLKGGGSAARGKFVGDITIKPRPCGSGSHLVSLQGGGYGCLQNA